MAAETIITDGVKIDGTISFKGSAKIDGKITGDITSDETITIGRNANVIANINTKNAIISGSFEGILNASGQVDITSTGKFIGDLIQPDSLLSIEKGGVFKGRSIGGPGKEDDLKKSKKI
jgi:cytoskeletal protein CcmA (bactofilin family)